MLVLNQVKMILWIIFTFAVFAVTEGAYPYYGRLIQSDWGSGATQSLAGSIYAMDKNRIQLVDFTFDPLGGENATFLLGTADTYEQVKGGTGEFPTVVINTPLKKYSGETVVLDLPSNPPFKQIKYIAIGDTYKQELYGGANIPSDFVAPTPQDIGTFVGTAHGVKSGQVTVLTDRTIRIRGFTYDGQGPDAFFYVGNTASVKSQNAPYGKIPDENGVSDEKAKAYSGQDITLTLPSTISATDLKWLSMYCISYNHNFGHVTFPADLNVPPHVGEVGLDRDGFNCEELSEKLQVAWLVAGDNITIELAGNIDRNKDYMAFGLSGNEATYNMIEADVVVVDYPDSRDARAIDYYLTGYAQCADNGGACPDTSTSNKGANDAMLVSAQITNGITRVKYTRKLNTGDSKDKVYKADDSMQQVVWAVGPLNTKNEAAKHYPADGRSSSPLALNFNRTIEDNCPSFKLTAKVEPPKFKPHHLYGDEVKVFTLDIGQSASEQGYKALTGLPSWGIAWYVNGILIPELHLKRGETYTFRVGGGTNPAEGSMYHPFYLTDNIKGGYSTNKNGTIYPGIVDGTEANYAVGGYCEWKLTFSAVDALAKGGFHKCFEEFKDDLYLDCSPGSEGYKEFKFTPTSSTPNLIYYQCYTHESLGWKVHIYDELPSKRKQVDGCASGARLSATGVVYSLTLLIVYLMN